MTRRRHCFAMVALLCAVAALRAGAQEEVSFEYRLPEGEDLTFVQESETRQVMSLAGMEIESSSEEKVTIDWEVGQRQDNGDVRVNYQVSAVQASMTFPFGIELEYDSEDDNPAPGTQFDFVLDVLDAVAKQEYTLIFNGDNEVTGVEGAEDVLAGLDDQIRAMVSDQFDNEYLAEVHRQELSRLPDGPVSVGDSWERTEEVRMEGGLSAEFTIEYRFEGTKEIDGKTLYHISMKVTNAEMSVGEPLAGQPAIEEFDVDIQDDSEGQVLYDPERGLIVEHQGRVHVAGRLTMNVGGQRFPADVDLTIKQKTTLVD